MQLESNNSRRHLFVCLRTSSRVPLSSFCLMNHSTSFTGRQNLLYLTCTFSTLTIWSLIPVPLSGSGQECGGSIIVTQVPQVPPCDLCLPHENVCGACRGRGWNTLRNLRRERPAVEFEGSKARNISGRSSLQDGRGYRCTVLTFCNEYANLFSWPRLSLTRCPLSHLH